MSDPQSSGIERFSDESNIYHQFEAATAFIRTKVVNKKQKQHLEYLLFSILYNLLSITQVIIGAAITALGPSGGDHVLAITILGALNTSIAGILALLKGRGLPQRLRRNVAELEHVLNYIEEHSTLLRYGSKKIPRDGIDSLIQETLRLYAEAEKTIERNQPDTYARERAFSDLESLSAEDALRQRKPSNNILGKRREESQEMKAQDPLWNAV